MRHFIPALALASLLSAPGLALATGNGNDNNGNQGFEAFAGFGAFTTAGQAGAFSAGGGQAESFANGVAGIDFNRCNCGGATFGGFQANEAGALTTGNGIGWGNSAGTAQGVAFGGFAGRLNRGH